MPKLWSTINLTVRGKLNIMITTPQGGSDVTRTWKRKERLFSLKTDRGARADQGIWGWRLKERGVDLEERRR